MVLPGRDFSRVIWPVRLEGNGFGFNSVSELPPFFSNFDRRITLLERRYIDDELWDEGLNRLQLRKKRLSSKNPLSFSFQFHRRPTAERKVPAGGGCLQTIVLVWCNNTWGISVHLRASEITARLLADIAFVKWAVDQIVKLTGVSKWPENPKIFWTIELASQMKYLIPSFLFHTYGEQSVLDFFVSGPDFPAILPGTQVTPNLWTDTITKHFWEEFIHPEKIKWMQRRRWSDKFLAITKTDWNEAKKVREELQSADL